MNRSRRLSIDILRVTAAAAVLLFHVLGSSANNDPQAAEPLKLLLSALAEALQWHVPVFFMITGYLWLGSSKPCTYAKMWSNIRKFILVLFTVGFAYALMERFFVSRAFSVKLPLLALSDVFTGNLWDHMWYMYSIIGVYLILPVIKPFFESNTPKQLGILIGILFVFTVISPVVENFTGYTLPVKFPMSYPMFYICAGGLLAKLGLSGKKVAAVCAAVFTASTVAVFLIELLVPSCKAFTALFNCSCALSLFTAVNAYLPEADSESSLLMSVSDCSFGIYLIHPFFINLMIKVFNIYPLRWCPPISLALTFVVIIAVSYIVIYLLRRLGFVRKYIL